MDALRFASRSRSRRRRASDIDAPEEWIVEEGVDALECGRSVA